MTAPSVADPRTKYPKPPVECFHGGQSFRDCKNFVCDFSITTNISGPPKSAVEAAKKAFVDLEHYPDQDAWVPRCHLADFLDIDPMEILVGNGASELIDVLVRIFPSTTTWMTGPWEAQYHEYSRAASAAGLVHVEKDADLTILVNPNSPTGNYLTLDQLRELVSKNEKTTYVIDESFLMCAGPEWRTMSAMNLIKEFGDRIIVMTSWTKVLACPLIRLGTVVSTKAVIARIQKLQAPWSVNGFAQAFFVAALHEKDYFRELWEEMPKIKVQMLKLLSEFGKPNFDSPDWVPFVYMDMGSPEIAARAEKVAFDAGCPVRNCASFSKPQFLRLAVRRMEHVNVLIAALKADETLMNMIASK